MNSPDPEGMSLLGKVIGAAVAVGTPIWGFFMLWNKKADKHAIANQLQPILNEQGLHREYFAKVFEKMEEHARRDDDTHRTMLQQMSDNHAEVLRELGRKQDRK